MIPELKNSYIGTVFNVLGFYAGWFACVIGGAHNNPWMGPGIVAIIILIQLRVFSVFPGKEALFLVVTGVFGFLLETFEIIMSIHEPKRVFIHYPLCPLWMLALWVIFGNTFNHCLKFLRSRIFISAILGALGGPLAFWGGEQLEALTLNENVLLSYGVLACIWAILVPLLFHISDRIVPRSQ